MPPVLSRLLAIPDSFFSTTGSVVVPVREPCAIISHPWCQSCLAANWQILSSAVAKCFKVYFTLYAASGAFRLKTWNYWRSQFIKDVFRSASMLIVNGCLVFCGNCLTRNVFGQMSPTLLRLTIFIGSLAAIFIERASRRYILAFYMSSNAVECVFNRMVEYNQLKPIKNIELLMFMVASGIFGCFVKSKQQDMQKHLKDISKPLMFILGRDEVSVPRTKQNADPFLSCFPKTQSVSKLTQALDRFFSYFGGGKSNLCPHRKTCLQYTSYGAIRGLTIGFLMSLSINCIRNLSNLSQPRKFFARALDRSNIRVAAFLALLVSTFRGCCCILRKITKSDSGFNGALAGIVSGASFFVLNSYIISLYAFLKAAEVLLKYLTKNSWLDRLRFKTELVYALAVVETIFAVVIWPQNVRPEYRAFINGVSGEKFKCVNRQLISTHWNLKLANVPSYPELDPNLQVVYEAIAEEQRRARLL